MLADAEAEVPIRRPIDPELEGPLEHLLVPVGRGVEHDQRLALGDLLAAHDLHHTPRFVFM
ncbi:MAG: hypothetical protein U5R31_17700 [Acidimicrobiia bacterium]|nr:hypothetical protein [Acidimicrobiia bacterium]